MCEHLILKKESLPSDSYFIVNSEKDNNKNLRSYKFPKMKYLFDYSLPITQEYVEDDICKKNKEGIYHIINIYLPPVTKIQIGSKYLAQLIFLKQFNIILKDEVSPLYININLKKLAEILLSKEKDDDLYFITDVLPINYLYFLQHLFKILYFNYSIIDNKYHVYCKQLLDLDLLTFYQINDIIRYDCEYIHFNKKTNSFKNKIDKLRNKWNKYFTNICQKEKLYLQERLENQKKFSIMISKEIKNRLIESIKISNILSLPLAELYHNLNTNNCMIYRLNRFFPFYKNIDNTGFLITEEGLYSVSRPKEAEMISKKIKQALGESTKELVVADMTANVGGNTLNFCKYFGHVYAFELQWLNYLILQNNIRVANFEEKCTIIHGDCLQFADKYKFDVIFFDPPWGGVNYKEQTHVDLHLGDKSMVDIVIDILAKNLSKLIAIKVPYNYNFKGFQEANIHYQTYKINNLLLVII